ncbi:MAG: hypothetical protein QM723_16035 [Myxococcaceae bacterium]
MKPHVVAPAYKSSLDAVLAHAAELSLTEEQQRRFEELDARRDQQDQESRARAKAAPTANEGSAPPSTGRRGRRGGGGGGSHGQASKDPQLNQQYDDHDTQAFTVALELMTEAQKPRAIELASKYREELFDYRQSLVR